MRAQDPLLAALLLVACAAAPALARGPELTDAQKQTLDRNFQLVLKKKKGPYSQNFCVCRDGQKKPVMLSDGRIVSPCGGLARFCAAFREPWAEALAE